MNDSYYMDIFIAETPHILLLQLWGISGCNFGEFTLQLCPISVCNKQLIRPIAIPTVKEESERALIRRRHQVTNSIRRSMQRIKSQLLYNGLKEPESLKRWSKKSIEELHSTLLPEEAKIVIESHIRNLQFHQHERKVIDQQLEVLSHKSEHEAIIDSLEMLAAAQGIDFQENLKPGTGTNAAWKEIKLLPLPFHLSDGCSLSKRCDQ